VLFYPVFRILCISYHDELLSVMIFTPHPDSFMHIVYIVWQDFQDQTCLPLCFLHSFPYISFIHTTAVEFFSKKKF